MLQSDRIQAVGDMGSKLQLLKILETGSHLYSSEHSGHPMNTTTELSPLYGYDSEFCPILMGAQLLERGS